MKKLMALTLWVGVAYASVSTADVLNLSSSSGAPGETVTLVLSTDNITLNANSAFNVDADISFDSTVLQYQTFRQVGQFTDAVATFTFPQVNPSAGKVSIALFAQYAAPPGGGDLLELDFLIGNAAQSGDSQLPIEITEPGSGNTTAGGNGVVSVAGTEVETVPIPLAALTLLGGLLLIFGSSRTRRHHFR